MHYPRNTGRQTALRFCKRIFLFCILLNCSGIAEAINLGFLRDLNVMAGHLFEGYSPWASKILDHGQEFIHPINRPVNVYPRLRSEIGVTHWLFVRDGPEDGIPLLPHRIKVARPLYRSNKETKVVIHGWADPSEKSEWVQEMKQGFLTNDDCNVVAVAWSGSNIGESRVPYTQAVADARLVGAEIVLVLQSLRKEFGTPSSLIHLIGYSLGAHVAGYVGSLMKGIQRITALDPSQPYFQGMPAAVRLDPTDAQFVDAWHTDARHVLEFSWGMTETVGHVDIFPNGGQEQPGCKDREKAAFTHQGIIKGLQQVFTCNHDRANWLALDSLLQVTPASQQCLAVAYACSDFNAFSQGRCADCGPNDEDCAPMTLAGHDKVNWKAKNAPTDKRFFLITSKDPPYCLFHYQIQLELLLSFGKPSLKVRFNMVIRGTLGATRLDLHRSSSWTLDAGRTSVVFLGTTPMSVGALNQAVLNWFPTSDTRIPAGSKIHLTTMQVNPMNFLSRSSQLQNRKTFNSFPYASIRLSPRRQTILNLT